MRLTPDELAAEAARWLVEPSEPDTGSTQMNIRMPNRMLAVIRGFAKRRGCGYQTLIKEWLHERICDEARLYLSDPWTIRLVDAEYVTSVESFSIERGALVVGG